jgi:hypothetical protein
MYKKENQLKVVFKPPKHILKELNIFINDKSLFF